MNDKQKIVCVYVAAIILAMGIYPPFHFNAQNSVVLNLGYGWIVNPPLVSGTFGTVDIGMLLTQWIGVLIIGGIAFFFIKDK